MWRWITPGLGLDLRGNKLDSKGRLLKGEMEAEGVIRGVGGGCSEVRHARNAEV